MKLTFHFQTLIMLTLTSILVIATALWGAVVYQSIYDIILKGFDRKLLALSGAAADFTDGDGHLRYQQPRQIITLSSGPALQLLGYDSTHGELVSIDPADGGAVLYGTVEIQAALSAVGSAPRAIAYDSVSGSIALLSGDGLMVSLLNSTAAPQPALSDPVDHILFADGILLLQRGRLLTAFGADAPLLTLAEPVSLLSNAPAPATYIGRALEDGALLWFDIHGAVLRRSALPIDQEISGLAFVGEDLYASSAALLRIDLANAAVIEDFAEGYYSERDSFFARYARHYQKTRAAAGLTYLYTYEYLGGKDIRYVLDGSLGDEHSPPGTIDDTMPEDSINDVAQAQARGQAFVSAIRTWPPWGLIKVAAEPVYTSNGRIVALAGADVEIGVIREKTRFALFSVIFVGASLLLLAGSVSYRVSQSLVRPLREIKNSALRIAAGYHGTRVAYESSDEIGLLAQSLNALSSRLAAQARQSLAYQRALTHGREQIALEHALNQVLSRGCDQLPTGLQCNAPLPEGAVCGHGNIGMLWKLRADNAGLLPATIENARVQRVALALLQAGKADAHDVLFLTLPKLAAIGRWDSESRILTIRCRTSLVLRQYDAVGTRSTLTAFDGMQINLLPGQRLVWATGQEMSGGLPQSEDQAC